tara:strand:+ start:30481 stop:31323 length:843 start_codon:yes stop_codon:yes gene_type:complete
MNKIRPKLRKRSLETLFELKIYLDRINDTVEQPDYIQHDPIQFIHAFENKKDIEIAGFFAALMAWGRRDIVINKVNDLLHRMNYKPFEFITRYGQDDFAILQGFKHRTFKPIDIHGIIFALQKIYQNYEDLEDFWNECHQNGKHENRPALAIFHEKIFGLTPELNNRTRKHISNPETGSTCKRLCMYLRWMIRKNSPVDIGIWNFMEPSELQIPFDVHVARQARRYGLVSRRSNDWKTVNELTDTLKKMDLADPVRYDFALFGLGALGLTLPKRFLLNKS